MKSDKREKLQMNLIQQDVFVRVISPVYDQKNDYAIESYVSQDEIIEDDGIRVKSTVQEYPITPQSVNSYADGTNYRNDLSAALSRSAPGRNIGDVSAMQELLSKGPEEVKAFFVSAYEKIAASKAENSVASKAEKSVVEDSNNG